MKNARKLVALTLALVMALAVAMPVAAQDENTDIMHYDWSENGDIQLDDVLFTASEVPFLQTAGQILEISVEDSQMRVANGDEIIFNFDETTAFVDGNDGTPVAPADLAESDEVIVYYGPALGRSYPPVGFAFVVIANTDENAMPPVFARVEAVEQADDGIIVTIQGGSILVTIPNELVITPLFTRNIIVPAQIAEGSELLFWYPMMALSFPAQAVAERVVFVRNAEVDAEVDTEVDIIEEAPGEAEVIQDPQYEDDLHVLPIQPTPTPQPPIAPPAVPEPEVFTLPRALSFFADQFVVRDGVTMVPLRFVAESMGFDVGWNDAQRVVTLSHDDGQTFSSITIGQNTFEGHTLEAAPTLINERTFVPISFFDLLVG